MDNKQIPSHHYIEHENSPNTSTTTPYVRETIKMKQNQFFKRYEDQLAEEVIGSRCSSTQVNPNSETYRFCD